VDAIITADERGTIASVNPAAERMFSYSAAEVLGQNVEMLMSSHRPDTNRQPRCALRSEHTDAPSGVAFGRLAVGSAPMLPHLFADEPLSPAAREPVRVALPRQ
jgi:PAS domain-containing protein